jgi:hypothetical protein
VLSTRSPRWLLGLLAALIGLPLPASVLRAEERHVTVVAVLATDRKNNIDPKVKCIAEEVQKLEPGLTGFRLVRITNKGMTIGKRDSFPLVDDQMLGVLLQQVEAKEKDERIRLTIKAPLAGEISYSTCCSKFFPIMTRYLTKDNERLIVAIMVKPGKKN